MNWFQYMSKKAELEAEWWRNSLYHLSNGLLHLFPKDSEPRLIGMGLFTSFGHSSFRVRFDIENDSKVYSCAVQFDFDRPISPELSKQKAPHSVANIEANLTGCECFVIRQTRNGIMGQVFSDSLIPQESTPYNILTTIKEIIINDNDDDDDDNDGGYDQHEEQPSGPPGSRTNVPSLI